MKMQLLQYIVIMYLNNSQFKEAWKVETNGEHDEKYQQKSSMTHLDNLISNKFEFK